MNLATLRRDGPIEILAMAFEKDENSEHPAHCKNGWAFARYVAAVGPVRDLEGHRVHAVTFKDWCTGAVFAENVSDYVLPVRETFYGWNNSGKL